MPEFTKTVVNGLTVTAQGRMWLVLAPDGTVIDTFATEQDALGFARVAGPANARQESAVPDVGAEDRPAKARSRSKKPRSRKPSQQPRATWFVRPEGPALWVLVATLLVLGGIVAVGALDSLGYGPAPSGVTTESRNPVALFLDTVRHLLGETLFNLLLIALAGFFIIFLIVISWQFFWEVFGDLLPRRRKDR